MAEEAAAAGAPVNFDEDEEVTPGYVAPAKKTVEEINNLDADDEALVRYKQTLLGAGAAGINSGGLEVKVLKMTFMSEGRDPIDLDLTGDLTKLKEQCITIKEGCEYKLKFQFTVGNQIVSGLRFQQNISRKSVPVSKLNLMLGSFGPREEPHEITTPDDEAPKGMIARGKYHAVCKIIDDDKTVHLGWEWTFKIEKDW